MVLGPPEGSVEGSTKVPPRLYFWSSWADPFRSQKGCAEGPPWPLYICTPSSFNFFWHFSPAVLQEMDFASHRFPGVFPKLFCKFCLRVSRVFLGLNGWCFRKSSVEGSPIILYICLPNGCCLIKSSLEGSANFAWHFSPSFWGQSCVNWWHVSTIQIQSPENDPSCLCCGGILSAYDSFWRVSSHGFLKGSWGSDFPMICGCYQVQFNHARGAHGTGEGFKCPNSPWQGTGPGCVARVEFLDI